MAWRSRGGIWATAVAASVRIRAKNERMGGFVPRPPAEANGTVVLRQPASRSDPILSLRFLLRGGNPTPVRGYEHDVGVRLKFRAD